MDLVQMKPAAAHPKKGNETTAAATPPPFPSGGINDEQPAPEPAFGNPNRSSSSTRTTATSSRVVPAADPAARTPTFPGSSHRYPTRARQRQGISSNSPPRKNEEENHNDAEGGQGVDEVHRTDPSGAAAATTTTTVRVRPPPPPGQPFQAAARSSPRNDSGNSKNDETTLTSTTRYPRKHIFRTKKRRASAALGQLRQKYQTSAILEWDGSYGCPNSGRTSTPESPLLSKQEEDEDRKVAALSSATRTTATSSHDGTAVATTSGATTTTTQERAPASSPTTTTAGVTKPPVPSSQGPPPATAGVEKKKKKQQQKQQRSLTTIQKGLATTSNPTTRTTAGVTKPPAPSSLTAAAETEQKKKKEQKKEWAPASSPTTRTRAGVTEPQALPSLSGQSKECLDWPLGQPPATAGAKQKKNRQQQRSLITTQKECATTSSPTMTIATAEVTKPPMPPALSGQSEECQGWHPPLPDAAVVEKQQQQRRSLTAAQTRPPESRTSTAATTAIQLPSPNATSPGFPPRTQKKPLGSGSTRTSTTAATIQLQMPPRTARSAPSLRSSSSSLQPSSECQRLPAAAALVKTNRHPASLPMRRRRRQQQQPPAPARRTTTIQLPTAASKLAPSSSSFPRPTRARWENSKQRRRQLKPPQPSLLLFPHLPQFRKPPPVARWENSKGQRWNLKAPPSYSTSATTTATPSSLLLQRTEPPPVARRERNRQEMRVLPEPASAVTTRTGKVVVPAASKAPSSRPPLNNESGEILLSRQHPPPFPRSPSRLTTRRTTSRPPFLQRIARRGSQPKPQGRDDSSFAVVALGGSAHGTKWKNHDVDVGVTRTGLFAPLAQPILPAGELPLGARVPRCESGLTPTMTTKTTSRYSFSQHVARRCSLPNSEQPSEPALPQAKDGGSHAMVVLGGSAQIHESKQGTKRKNRDDDDDIAGTRTSQPAPLAQPMLLTGEVPQGVVMDTAAAVAAETQRLKELEGKLTRADLQIQELKEITKKKNKEFQKLKQQVTFLLNQPERPPQRHVHFPPSQIR